LSILIEARAILERLVAFATVSRDSNLDIIAHIADHLRAAGIAPVVVPSPDGTKAALYAQVGPDAPGGVVLSGHSDVVPVDGQDWTLPPFALTERDGRLYGRGTADMKGFVALSIAAMIRAAQGQLSRPLQIAVSYDEEVGCLGAPVMIAHMQAHGLTRADSVIVGEPSMMQVVTGHKGVQVFHVDVRGHEVHSSRLPQGVSAIMEGARLIAWANQMNAGHAAATPSALAVPFDPPHTTLHVGQISGGTANNIVARDCRFSLEIRAVPGESMDGWQARAMDQAAGMTAQMTARVPGTGITLTPLCAVPPLAPEGNGPAERLCRRLTGDNGSHVVSYGTEGGQFQAAGYSVVVCGPGDIAQAHGADEFISLDQFAAGAAFMERLLADLAD